MFCARFSVAFGYTIALLALSAAVFCNVVSFVNGSGETRLFKVRFGMTLHGVSWCVHATHGDETCQFLSFSDIDEKLDELGIKACSEVRAYRLVAIAASIIAALVGAAFVIALPVSFIWFDCKRGLVRTFSVLFPINFLLMAAAGVCVMLLARKKSCDSNTWDLRSFDVGLAPFGAILSSLLFLGSSLLLLLANCCSHQAAYAEGYIQAK